MPNFKVTLIAPVALTATFEFEVEAEDADKADEIALDEYKKIQAADDAAYKLYRQGKAPYPTPVVNWSVDQDDVESNLDQRNIEVDSVREVK